MVATRKKNGSRRIIMEYRERNNGIRNKSARNNKNHAELKRLGSRNKSSRVKMALKNE